MRRKLRIPMLAAFAGMLAIPRAAEVKYTPIEEAAPILDAMHEILPAELLRSDGDERRKAWNTWVRNHDAEIRARLTQGDIDSVVNLLMFGTSFTDAPRLTSAQLRSLSDNAVASDRTNMPDTWQMLLSKRVRDLLNGMATPDGNERLQFARKTIERAGINFAESNGGERARVYLLKNVQRVVQEQSGFRQSLTVAKSLHNPTEEFAERSKLYKDRGLSLDTSLPPNYALEVALRDMKSRGALKLDGVRRVGIIGPGLDFADKQEGFDFYPTQTVQPFAVMDSLIRLGLADPKKLEVDALDLSERVLDHVRRIAVNAAKGQGYEIQLPKDPSREWTPELVMYWRRFGDQVGSPIAPRQVPPALKSLALRAVRVRPEFLKRMDTFDADIVLQRVAVDDSEKYDLLIATNILVYYDTFEQSLAMTNAAAMLKPGGYLLTNNLLLELPGSALKAEDYVSVQYSPKEADGDIVIRYRRVR